jgi:hypothetical protein
MWNVLRILTGRPPADPRARRVLFFQRYRARTLIVHTGLTIDWLEELLKQGGGGGHFRIDARLTPARTPTPVEWVVHGFILPLGLPLPLIARVSDDSIGIRHLVRHGAVCHPTDIAWILEDMGGGSVGSGARMRSCIPMATAFAPNGASRPTTMPSIRRMAHSEMQC